MAIQFLLSGSQPHISVYFSILPHLLQPSVSLWTPYFFIPPPLPAFLALTPIFPPMQGKMQALSHPPLLVPSWPMTNPKPKAQTQASKCCVCEAAAATTAALISACAFLRAHGGACVTSPEKPPHSVLGETVATASHFLKLLIQHLSKAWSSVIVGRATAMWSVFPCLQWTSGCDLRGTFASYKEKLRRLGLSSL